MARDCGGMNMETIICKGPHQDGSCDIGILGPGCPCYAMGLGNAHYPVPAIGSTWDSWYSNNDDGWWNKRRVWGYKD